MFKPGNKKIAGRQKGTPNKNKQVVREIVEAALGKSIPDRLIEIAKSNPRLEAGILADLLPYAHPKLQAVEHSGEIGNTAASEAVKELSDWLKKTRELK